MLGSAGENIRFSLERNGERYAVCAVRCGESWLLSFSRPPEVGSRGATLAGNLSGHMSDTLLSLRAAANQLNDMLDLNGVDTKGYTNILFRGIYQLQRMAKNLSILSGQNDGRLTAGRETLDLAQLVGDLVDTVNHFTDGRIEWTVEDSQQALLAEVHAESISIMLLNVLSNSLQHAAENSVIRVSLKPLGSRLILTVTDNCGGMSAEALSHVFTKYSDEVSLSAYTDGVGIGLAAAKRIAELHGGAIMIESRTGQGTLVRMMLPAADKNVVRLPSSLLRTGDGMDMVLTQLSCFLSRDFYTKRYMD